MPTRSILHHNLREFDIILFSTGTVACSILREFEVLPLKVAICTNCHPSSPSERCAPRSDTTMLPTIDGSYKELHLVTSRTQLLVNLSEYTTPIIMHVLEACISTRTGYVDKCVHTEIISTIKNKFDSRCGIKIVQGCAGLPFLIDLAVSHIGWDRSVRDIKCTINPGNGFKEVWNNVSGSEWLFYTGSYVGNLSYNILSKSYELPLNGFIQDLLMRSRKIFGKKGMKFAPTRVVICFSTLTNFMVYLLAILAIFLNKIGIWKRKYKNDTKMIISLVGTTTKATEAIKLEVKVDNSVYDLSAICLAQIAASIIENSDLMYGVLTPAIVLKGTGIIERLMYKKIKFDHFFE